MKTLFVKRFLVVSAASALLSSVSLAQTATPTVTNAPAPAATHVAPALAPAPAAPLESGSAWDQCCAAMADHVDVGTRFTYFVLADRSRGANNHFYGSIDKLDAVQNYWPLKLFVDYKVTPYWGFELTWDQIQAKTITKRDGHTDGNINLDGPLLSAFGRYPNDTAFTPYAGAGVAYFFASFEEDYYWVHALNRQTGFYNNGPDWNQNIAMDNTFGWFGYGGVSIALQERLSADLYVRYTHVEVDGTHYNLMGRDVTDATSMTFPMSNTAFGLGVRYSF